MKPQVKGTVGGVNVEWLRAPTLAEGEARVRVDGGAEIPVRWKVDAQGVRLEFDDRMVGFDARAARDEETGWSVGLTSRSGPESWEGLRFERGGELAGTAKAAVKKARVRAQMPGKIIRVLVAEGAVVEKGQSVIVMEAMKMENEIKAPISGRITGLKVEPGQAVENGAELCQVIP